MDRIAPHSLEAEEAVLGCILTDPECLIDVASRVQAQDFYSSHCEMIFSAMLELDDAGIRVDKIALVACLRQSNGLDAIGGPKFLTRLMETIPTQASVAYYASLVAEKSLLRKLIRAGYEIQRIGYESEHDPAEGLSRAVERLAMVEAGKDAEEHLSPAQRLANAQERALFPKAVDKVGSPWPTLDEHIGGFYPGEMIVWAGSPKVGKSNGMVTLADYIAANYGQVVYFSIEMGESGLSERQMALYSGVSVIRQRSGNLTDRERVRIAEALEHGMNIPLEVVHRRVRSLGAMRRMLRMLQRNGPIKSIFVDHVSKIAEVINASKHQANKVERLDYVYQALIELGVEFECPIHVVQHVNREGQANARPRMIDLRDGGNPEGHAHAVLFFFREDTMNEKGLAHEGELIIAASRNGQTGTIPMEYNGARGLWTERGTRNAWYEPLQPRF